MEQEDLTPTDKSQCQAEIPNGAGPFTLGGVPRLIRCTNKPTVILTEKESQADGLVGSMSLCTDCFDVFNEQMPDHNVIVTVI